MSQEQGLGSYLVEADLYLVVLCDFIAINAYYRTLAKHTVSHSVAGFPCG